MSIPLGYAAVTTTCFSVVEDEYSKLEREADKHAQIYLQNALKNTDENTTQSYASHSSYTFQPSQTVVKGALQNGFQSADKWTIFPEVQNQLERGRTPLEQSQLHEIIRNSGDRKNRKMLPDLQGNFTNLC